MDALPLEAAFDEQPRRLHALEHVLNTHHVPAQHLEKIQRRITVVMFQMCRKVLKRMFSS